MTTQSLQEGLTIAVAVEGMGGPERLSPLAQWDQKGRSLGVESLHRDPRLRGPAQLLNTLFALVYYSPVLVQSERGWMVK